MEMFGYRAQLQGFISYRPAPFSSDVQLRGWYLAKEMGITNHSVLRQTGHVSCYSQLSLSKNLKKIPLVGESNKLLSNTCYLPTANTRC